MSAPKPLWLRQEVVEDWQSGRKAADIAEERQLSRSSVYAILHRYKARGFEGLAADYSACGRPAAKGLIYRAARFLKYKHRDWGAPLIRLLLIERYGDVVPSARTLQRWFKRAHLNPIVQKRPPVNRAKSSKVHGCWQIDAKERLPIGACYLSIVDEHSGACLQTPVFPPSAHLSTIVETGAKADD